MKPNPMTIPYAGNTKMYINLRMTPTTEALGVMEIMIATKVAP